MKQYDSLCKTSVENDEKIKTAQAHKNRLAFTPQASPGIVKNRCSYTTMCQTYTFSTHT